MSETSLKTSASSPRLSRASTATVSVSGGRRTGGIEIEPVFRWSSPYRGDSKYFEEVLFLAGKRQGTCELYRFIGSESGREVVPGHECIDRPFPPEHVYKFSHVPMINGLRFWVDVLDFSLFGAIQKRQMNEILLRGPPHQGTLLSSSQR